MPKNTFQRPQPVNHGKFGKSVPGGRLPPAKGPVPQKPVLNPLLRGIKPGQKH